MTDEDRALLRDLDELGLDEDSFRAVALLPLVEVAWADASIQPQERKTILEIARGHDLLRGRGARVVEVWLRERPDEETFHKGRSVLARLAHKREGLGRDLPEHAVETVVDLCAQVAEAAGGLFGTYFTVSASERDALRRIAQHLERASAEAAGPLRGIAGRTIPPDWAPLLDELTDEGG